MEECKPLFLPLEYRITARRVGRTVGILLTNGHERKVNQRLKKIFNKISPDKIKGDGAFIVFPLEFVPIMINVIKDYKKEKNL